LLLNKIQKLTDFSILD